MLLGGFFFFFFCFVFYNGFQNDEDDNNNKKEGKTDDELFGVRVLHDQLTSVMLLSLCRVIPKTLMPREVCPPLLLVVARSPAAFLLQFFLSTIFYFVFIFSFLPLITIGFGL